VVQDGIFSIAVEDDGPGLTEDARSRLFEPFFTTKASGTGLGLAITRRLAQALGGQLNIGPREGKGTAARIQLPWSGSSS
jgi:signal transduction histidine kinase